MRGYATVAKGTAVAASSQLSSVPHTLASAATRASACATAPRRDLGRDAQPTRRQVDICCAPVYYPHRYPHYNHRAHPRRTRPHTSPATANTHTKNSKQDIWPPPAIPIQTPPAWPRTPEGRYNRNRHSHNDRVWVAYSFSFSHTHRDPSSAPMSYVRSA